MKRRTEQGCRHWITSWDQLGDSPAGWPQAAAVASTLLCNAGVL